MAGWVRPDVRDVAAVFDNISVWWYTLYTMRDAKGRFIKGQRASPSTEFKKGQHWRSPKPYWDKDWLEHEYIVLEKSAETIAQEQGCVEGNILYFLHKFGIPRRNVSGARAVKYWGLKGPDNPMYGRTGTDSPNWKGGTTPERQGFYASQEWAVAVSAVWKRDRATCQRCGRLPEQRGSFHIHHIVSFEVEELRADYDNLCLLCRECHRWIHSKENKDREFLSS